MPIRQEFFEMLKTDFDNIYSVNLKAIDERLTLLKLNITFFSAPFFVLTALVSADIITSDQLLSLSTIPKYIFAFVLICGIANLIPLIRFIEVTGTHMRTTRIINNFRRLYCSQLKDFFKKAKWEPNLPIDPKYPPTFEVFSWSGLNIFLIALLNSLYITIGIFGMDKYSPISVGGIFVFIVVSFLQYIIYYIKGRGPNPFSSKPENPENYKQIEI